MLLYLTVLRPCIITLHLHGYGATTLHAALLEIVRPSPGLSPSNKKAECGGSDDHSEKAAIGSSWRVETETMVE